MASPLARKTKQPRCQGATGSGSGSPGGCFGVQSPPEPWQRCGQRRRKANPSGVIHTLTPYFDGHLWRKYGQKTIKDSRHPRLYYRCSYREDRQCMASKLLQQLNNDDPPLFEVTYMHEHTCKAEPIQAPDVGDAITGPPAASSGGFVLNFGSGSGGGDAPPVQQKRQRNNHRQSGAVPPSPSPATMGFESANSQLRDNPDFFHSDVPPGAGAAFPTELWPSPLSWTSSSDEGDLFPVWDSFVGSGFDDDPSFSIPEVGMSSWETNSAGAAYSSMTRTVEHVRELKKIIY